MKKLKTAILISGRGSNMKALIEAAKSDDYPAEIVFVLSNKQDAAGLAYAAEHGIETLAISHRDFVDRVSFDMKIDEELQKRGIEMICLAGFMRVLSSEFVQKWEGKAINIHPSLLPAFKGLDTHQRAIDLGVKYHGTTAHYVSVGVDEGRIISQRVIEIFPSDTAESLANRLLPFEHECFVEALKVAANAILIGG